MQYGDAQCRNVESAIMTPVALAARSIDTPAPLAPPSARRPRSVTALEEAMEIRASAPAGTRPSPLRTIRCDPVIVRSASVAPASPASVRSAAGPPGRVIVRGPYGPGASWIVPPATPLARAPANSAPVVTRTVSAAEVAGTKAA